MNSVRRLEEKEFPARLLEIPEPPKKLFARGVLPDFETYRYLSVVGSRKHTSYGKEVCRKLITGLSGHTIVIISGLALGIDTIAHESAIEAGLPTIAIPGSGLNDSVLYPRTNTNLAQKIIEAGGCLLSEYEPDFQATMWSFPRRNRIMAGISHAVLIIEAEEKSGTLITARLATEYNRDVLAVPGSIFSDASAGAHMLLKLGATPITSSNDILEALHLNPIEGEEISKDYSNLNDDERLIMELLSEPQSRDQLFLALKKPAHEVSTILTLLELKGLIAENMGMFHKL